MSKFRKKPTDRILAATLSVAMTACFTPLSVFAEPEQQPTTSVVQNSTNVNTETVTESTTVDLTTAETTDISQTIESTDSTSSTESSEIDPTIPSESTATEYALHLNLDEEYKDFLKIWLNEQETTECSVRIGDEISLKMEIVDASYAHYRLSGIKLGENALFEEDVNGKSIFEGKFAVTQEMIDSAAETGIIDIQIEVAQVYQITFSFNPLNGTVVPTQEYTAIDGNDPSKTIGTVVLNQDDTIGFTATPNEHYRVSEIKIDEKSETYNENDKAVEILSNQLETNKDHTIEVFFMLNKYSLKAADNIQNGSVKFSNNETEYGTNVDVTVTPDEGYYISAISLDGENIPASKVRNGIFTIENITENHEIGAEFSAFSNAVETDFSLNSDAAIENEKNAFVFSKGADAIFSTQKDGIRLIGDNDEIISGDEHSKQVVLNTNTHVKAVQLYYQESEYVEPSWHEFTYDSPLEISFYEGAVASLELPYLDKEKYSSYNDDVILTLNIDIPNENYPDISKIEYWIDGENDHIELDVTDRTITIPAADYNRKDIKVHVLITDADGHTTNVSSDSFNINATTPTVEVSIDGELLTGADTGYYSEGRTAIVTIHDKDYTIKKDIDAFSIFCDDVELSADEKNNMISWSESGDTLTANIRFDRTGDYSWNVHYTNGAGIYNEGITAEDGDSVYSFCVDKVSPTAKIKTSETAWDTLKEVLSFQIFKSSNIGILVESSDLDSGIKEVKYFKDTYTENLRNISEPTKLFAELEMLYNSEESPFLTYNGSFEIENQEKAVVYVRVMDRAGRVTYISSDGLIVDNQAPKVIELTSNEDPDKKIQNRTVEFEVKVNDLFAENEAFSGINKVYYVVKKSNNVIREEKLYTWSESEGALLDKWTGSFQLNPNEVKEYNQDNLTVEVYAEDNAGNTLDTSANVSINVNTLDAEVSFEDEWNENRLDNSYFTSRTATVRIKNDRDSSFDATAAEQAIIDAVSASEITDYNGNELVEVPEDLITIEEWKTEGNDHIATVQFNYYGNYTWKNTVYTNKAGNSVSLLDNGEINFTIDKVAPTGSFKTNENLCEELLSILTFGIYTSNSYEISAESSDKTSPTVISYYISHDTNGSKPLDKNGLDALQEQEWKPYSNSFTIDNPDNYVIYIRITDYAGNYTYLCSDGHIIDKTAPTVELKPENPVTELDGKPVYNESYADGIQIAVSVTETTPYAGLQTVEYWVEADGEVTQENTLYDFKIEKPTYGELQPEFKDTIIVDPSLNNSSNVVVYVKAIDNAGNERIESASIDIDITEPSISVSYDNNHDNNGNTYFDDNRTATIVITERTNHFDINDATNGIVITAVDIDGVMVDNAYTISNWKTMQGETPDQDTHTATISYSKDANYEFNISYTDKAKNNNSKVVTGTSVAPYDFTVDKTPPTGTITALSAEGRELTWDRLIDSLNFGFWSNSNIHISKTNDDRTSPIASVDYYKVLSTDASDATTALTAGDLNAVTAWKPFNELDIQPNEQFTVYLRIIDMAGNTTYISTNGLIVDNNAPHEEFNAPEINITPEQSESGIYNGDVRIAISVDDPLVGGTYSGLRNISYRVLNMGTETQSGTLYEFQSENPQQSDLLKSWTGEITVSSELNNSNDVVIEVYAEDNAVNGSSESTAIKIDTTAPTISVSYTNNASNGILYKDGRTAQISISERNFSEKYVTLLVNGNSYSPASSWRSSGGSGNGDNTIWYAEVPFTVDGDYTFSIACTDLAANKSGDVNYGNSTHPTEFTIDGTKPVISVAFIEDENPHEDNYYQNPRTAQITIDELHFDKSVATDGVECNVTVDKHDKNDTASSTVQLSDWSQIPGSNRYVATMNCADDAQYTLSVNYTDMAGNIGEAYSTSFYVDTVDPSLTVSVNDSDKRGAYSGKIDALVSYDDTNFDADNVDISMHGVNVDVKDCKITGDTLVFTLENESGDIIEWTGSFSGIKEEGSSKVYGRKLTLDNFPEGNELKEFDDIYTITVSLTDKSGRKTTKDLTFSVNRFGSTYDINRIKDVLGTYTQTSPRIVVSEINPDELTEYSITLFKNNETITLNKGTDFDVDVIGEANEWHEYVYTIDESNFTDDGVYSIVLHSVDKANNVSENTLDTKDSEISFVVDNTSPIAMVANIESGKTYAENSRRVIMTAEDNILLNSIAVYLDNENQIYKEWSAEEIANILENDNEGEREFSFDINGDSTRSHTLRIVCTDAAGNVTELAFDDFYVTTNIWIRFINNKPLLFGSIAGILLLAGGIAFIILKKKKRS